MSTPSPEAQGVPMVLDVYAYEAGLTEGRREGAERMEAAEAVAAELQTLLDRAPSRKTLNLSKTWQRQVSAALARWREVTK